MKRFLLIILIGIFNPVFAQIGDIIMSYSDYKQLVKAGHPIAVQGNLQAELGLNEVRKTKGINDPTIFGDLGKKEFENTSYYNLLNAGLKIPTWYGVSFQGGIESNSGKYVNPENFTPTDGLLYAGIEINLGKGLLMNQRKAALQQAEIFNQQTKEAQKLIWNNLLLESGKAYWNWYEAYQNVAVYENALNIASQRLAAVWEDARQGERPFIDTLESGIQYQTRIVQHQQAVLDYANAKALVEIYLWQDGNIPLELSDLVIPENNSIKEQYSDSLVNLVNQHPELKTARLDLEKEEINLRLNREKYKPELNIKYNLIAERNNFNREAISPSNYNMGVQLKMPVFVREARGASKMSKIKIEQKSLSISFKEMELKYKIQVAINELNTYQTTLSTLEKTVEDYQKLLEGERELFDAGESSLFMVNSREMSYIQSQLMLNKSISKIRKAEIKIHHSLGNLYQL